METCSNKVSLISRVGEAGAVLAGVALLVCHHRSRDNPSVQAADPIRTSGDLTKYSAQRIANMIRANCKAWETGVITWSQFCRVQAATWDLADRSEPHNIGSPRVRAVQRQLSRGTGLRVVKTTDRDFAVRGLAGQINPSPTERLRLVSQNLCTMEELPRRRVSLLDRYGYAVAVLACIITGVGETAAIIAIARHTSHWLG